VTRSPAGGEFAKLLGAELRGLRVSRGLSLRGLAAQIGLSGHGGLLDYEHGRRIPPEDIVVACERTLDVRDGRLRNLREKALAERADHEAGLLLEPSDPAAAVPAPAPADEVPAPAVTPWWRRGRSAVLAVAAAAAIGAAGLSVAWSGHNSSPGPRAVPVRMGFEKDSLRWWVLYGAQVAKIQTTSSIAYEGHRAALVTVTGGSASKGYSAVGISHDLGGLRAGMRVTLRLWVPGPQEAGVSFLVHDSHGANHWAKENQAAGTQQTETPLPARPGWSKFTWTVPDVDTVTTIGIQIWSENDQPVLIGIDAITW
jgi:transcriptional regulator with XRE-family HTH domain